MLYEVITNIMINKQLLSVQITRKPSDAVIHRNNIRIEAADQIIQRLQRGNLSACGHINIHTKRRDGRFGMKFRIRMHRDVTFIEMSQHRLAAGTQTGKRIFGNQKCDARALRVIILFVYSYNFV